MQVRATTTGDGTEAEWVPGPTETDAAPRNPVILAGSDERERAEGAWRAARAISEAPRLTDAHPIVIVHPGFAERNALIAGARALDQPWQGNVVARLHADSVLAGAASHAELAGELPADGRLAEDPFVVLARTNAGRPVVVAARGSFEGRDRLLLLSFVDAGSLTSAALVRAVLHAAHTPESLTELAAPHIRDETVAEWRRPAVPAAVSNVDDQRAASDGRWLWILALGLLVAEWWMRRPAMERLAQMAHDRAA
jgi:hypothetical protein